MGDVTALCRNPSSAAVSNLLENELAIEHDCVSQLTLKQLTFNKLFSAVGLQTDFLCVCEDYFGGLKPACPYNRWDFEWDAFECK